MATITILKALRAFESLSAAMSAIPLAYFMLVADIDNCPPGLDEWAYPLYLPGDSENAYGYLVPNLVRSISWPSDFKVSHSPMRKVQVSDRSNSKNTSEAVNNALAAAVERCAHKGLFKAPPGVSQDLRVLGAPYPVRLNRFAASLFGIVHQAAYLMVYNRTATGEMEIWVARRSAEVATYPNKLATVGGLVCAADTTPLEAIIRLAGEETSLPSHLVRQRIRDVGLIRYMTILPLRYIENDSRIKPCMVHVYEMEVDWPLSPKRGNSEVESFSKMDAKEVRRAL